MSSIAIDEPLFGSEGELLALSKRFSSVAPLFPAAPAAIEGVATPSFTLTPRIVFGIVLGAGFWIGGTAALWSMVSLLG